MKVFILGLDGATFDCLDPMMADGVLPNISAMAATGVRAPLRTIFPPVTGPAWLAIATGMNPGRTGVFDYINRRNADEDVTVPVSSAAYRGRAIWDLLGRQGFKVGVYNYPTLSPPPAVNGFSVTGMGGYSRERLTNPPELERELQELTGGYEVQLNLRDRRYRDKELLFLDDVNRVAEKQYKCLRHLMSSRDWDFFFGVFHYTDWMQHMLWRHLDKEHPFYEPGRSPRVKKEFAATWAHLDAMIGELAAALPEDAVFLIVSDHGAGPIDSAFYPNTWLEKRGWLRKNAAGWRRMLAGRLRPLSADVDNKYLGKVLKHFKKRLLGRKGVLELIDQERSMAYCPDHAAMFGCINLTKRGASEKGFRERIIAELEQLAREVEGVQEIKVLRRENLYVGPYVHLAPDILFVVNGYRTSVEVDFHREAFSARPSLDIRTGGHRDHGIFLARGRHIKAAALAEVSVLDIAPTVLALFSTEIPGDVDGTVLTDIMGSEGLQMLEIKKGGYSAGEGSRAADAGDLEEMKKTLESLGYM